MSLIKKKKHVSKKNKKAWRKHCDIKDVEDFLEDQRLEERLGKFEAKTDSELFVVDTVGEEKPEVVDVKPLTLKQKKRALLPVTPKCYEVLLSTSKVQDPNAKRNYVNPVGTKPTALSKLSLKKQFEKGAYLKKVELARKNRRIVRDKKRRIKQIRNTFDKNIWGEDLPEVKGIPSTLCDDFISTEAQLHNVLPEQRLRPKPAPPKTVVTRPAVVTPHPGVSYNPSYQEHQDLLQQVVQHEEKLMKKEAHLHRVTTSMFSRLTPNEKENQWREEMSEGLPKPHNPANAPSTPSDDDTDNEYKAINPPVKNKKKDHKARRKQKERIAEKERLKREKIDKKKITDIYKLRKLQTSISGKEKREAELRVKRAGRRALLAATAPPALNAHKTPAPQPDLVEPSHLSGDLRNITSTGNLLRDRFESLQRRGALAASKLMMTKKKRLKAYFKPGHKVTEKDVENYLQKKMVKKTNKKAVVTK
ncbi:PREDICTED: uncharacterized protein CG1785 [Papilio xuthus]|uniref:Ribosome biogenesis protein NOP53 n=1 Tax=Papilio xuthus TaxID=66420 RepID=A0AAJ7E7C1_PAPXU|nr:PREDICTED: uncharacterized protein CG1785 [Papilio xuthus]